MGLLQWNKNRSKTIAVVFILIVFCVLYSERKGYAAMLSFVPDKTEVTLGENFNVKVRISEVENLFGAPFHIHYPTDLLDVVRVEEKGFLKKDGHKTTFLHKNDPEHGTIIVGLSRLGNISGSNGSGALVVLTLHARKIGVVNLSFERVDFKDNKLRSIPVSVRPVRIVIDKEKSKAILP